MMFRRFTQPRRPVAAAVAVLAVSAAAAAGCGTATSVARHPVTGGASVIVVRDNANGKTVPARAGDRIELILASSYWSVAGSSAPRVLREDGPTVLLPRPSNCPTIPGLGCVPVRTDFTALTGGKAVITASRSSCGEALRCMPDQTRFTVTIVIGNPNVS